MKLIKRSFLFVLLTTLLACSEYHSEDLITFNLKGKVSSVNSTKYRAVEKFGEVEKGREVARDESDEVDLQHANISLVFDNEGNLEWQTYFDKYGDIELKTSIKDTVINCYSSNGDLMLRFITNDIYTPTEVCLYNADGKLESKTFVKYDDNKNLIEEKEYANSGKLIAKSAYQYNKESLVSTENRLVIEESDGYYSNSVDTIKSTITYKYNDKNDIVEYTVKKNKQTVTKTYKYKYDKNKNWTQLIEYQGLTPEYLIERKIEYSK